MTDLELIHALTQHLARSFTTSGHLAMRNPRESLGECSWQRCGKGCITARALLDEAVSRLETLADERPVQARLLEGVAR